jgi:hypothetical protein
MGPLCIDHDPPRTTFWPRGRPWTGTTATTIGTTPVAAEIITGPPAGSELPGDAWPLRQTLLGADERTTL